MTVKTKSRFKKPWAGICVCLLHGFRKLCWDLQDAGFFSVRSDIIHKIRDLSVSLCEAPLFWRGCHDLFFMIVCVGRLIMWFNMEWQNNKHLKNTWDVVSYYLGLSGLSMILRYFNDIPPSSLERRGRREEGYNVHRQADAWQAAMLSEKASFCLEFLNIFATGCCLTWTINSQITNQTTQCEANYKK